MDVSLAAAAHVWWEVAVMGESMYFKVQEYLGVFSNLC